MKDNHLFEDLIDPVSLFEIDQLEDRKPVGALVENTDLVVTRFDDRFSVLYGRCLHRGAMLADGSVDEMGLYLASR